MTPKDPYKVPKAMQPRFEEITTLTDAVCSEHLTTEYTDLCRKLCAALSRKRPSPLARGRPANWAGAILYTIARVNFLFDPAQDPHMSADDICDAAGVNKNTASAKSTQIMDMLDIYQLDPNWALPSKMNDNPLAWMILVDGYAVDARMLPPEIQQLAYEKGLIPYIPGDD